MYGLYDKEGILRFVDTDKDACLAYAELFELGSTSYCLINLSSDTKAAKGTNTNLDLSLEECNKLNPSLQIFPLSIAQFNRATLFLEPVFVNILLT